MLSFSDFPTAAEPLRYFCELSAIPHASGNTDKVADYLVAFAEAHGLYCIRDSYNNVLIRKAASPSMKDRPTVIFQGHTDMVAEKDPDSDKDMDKEGITLRREGDFLTAEGTTLGGDDGVAVAYALAVLASDTIIHPEFEALFTSDEEIGLVGATNLDVGEIRGKLLINIDSDVEGVFTVGCAGGVRCDAELALTYADAPREAYRLTVSGLQGGHSGVEIDRGRLNAIKATIELLSPLRDFRLYSLQGGCADNAIPSECTVCFTASAEVEELVRSAGARIKEEYRKTDGGLTIALERVTAASRALSIQDTQKIISLLENTRTGVLKMSEEIPGLVETSENLASVALGDTFRTVISVRSSKSKERDNAVKILRELYEAAGADFSTRGEYPAWEYAGKGHLETVMEEVYEKMYGKRPEVVIIHAGLECGILSEKIPGLSAVSIGPDNFDIHTPRERLSLSSFARVWEYLKEVLKSI